MDATRKSLDVGLASERLDVVGAAASLTCALHCAVLPFVVTLLPVWGLAFLAEAWMEWLFLAAAAVVGLVSLSRGYRAHRSRRTLALLSSALTLMVLGRLAEEHLWSVPGELLMVVGGLTLAGAHLLNAFLCRRCPGCL